jgi:decaprenylphospho-beta-D-erythro-pentofuranosid-2-ulose 2-reductase
VYLLILGANSDVAQALARKFAQAEHANFYLASRDMALLQKSARDLEIRYQVEAQALFFDATDYASHAQFYQQLNPKPDGVVLAFGNLGDQQSAQADFQEARKIIDTNFLGALSILEIVAADFAQRHHGFIIGLSSAAGERGRQRNYLYGAAKGALTVLLSGLRNRLFPAKVRVITVLPGFVRTKMTEGIELYSKLEVQPEEVAEAIYKGYKKGKDIIYPNWLWKLVISVIRNIPEPLFKRLNI